MLKNQEYMLKNTIRKTHVKKAIRKIRDIAKNRQLFIHCKTGRSSLKALKILNLQLSMN